MSPDERARRAQQAQQALDFIRPAFEHLRGQYEARLREIAAAAPWEAKKITALAQAIRISEVAQQHLEIIIADGSDAHAQIDYARKVEAMSNPDRRLLNIGSWGR